MNSLNFISMPKKQCGAATILVAVVLLFAITIVSIFTARTAITEQKITGNEFRSQQAFEAAEAGLQYGIAYNLVDPDQVDNANPIDPTPDGIVDDISADSPVVNGGATANNPIYNVSLTDISASSDMSKIRITSIGQSDDRTASRTISQVIRKIPLLPNIPKSPLTSRGTVVGGGNFSVTNNYSTATIWSGGDMSTFGSFNTFIKINGANDQESTTKNGGTITLGPDVIVNDANLANATTAEYFQNFFGDTKANVLAAADHTTIADYIANGGGESAVIYVTGNTDLEPLGSLTEPVILIVDGTLSLGANDDFFGMIYATAMDGNANGDITGAVVVESAPLVNGTPEIIYEPSVLATLAQKLNKNGAVSGSWKDW